MKKNFPLVAGIAIPILMILFVAGSIYLPGIFVRPTYSFLYLSGATYGEPYFVVSGQLVKNSATSTYPQNYRLFVYDIAQNQSKAISFEDAQKLSLDPDVQSPDGFEVVSGTGGGGFFPFFYESNYDYNAQYLKGHNISKKLNIQTQGNYYDNFMFLGWINH